MSRTNKKVILASSILGLLLGVFITYFLFPRVITRNNLIESEKHITDTVFVEKDKIVVHEVKKTVFIKDTVRIEVKTDSLENDSQLTSTVDSVAVQSSASDSLNDTLVVHEVDDSLRIAIEDSVSVEPYEYVQSGGSSIQVSKNELVYVLQIKPEGNASNFYCRKNSELDSLLMDNYTPVENQDGRIRVEFWASPLNSVGYFLNKNRLVLFGFYQYNRLELKYLDDGSLQMNYLDNEYVLQCSDVFQSLVLKKE